MNIFIDIYNSYVWWFSLIYYSIIYIIPPFSVVIGATGLFLAYKKYKNKRKNNDYVELSNYDDIRSFDEDRSLLSSV